MQTYQKNLIILLLSSLSIISYAQCIIDTYDARQKRQSIRVLYYDVFKDYVDRNMYLGESCQLHLDIPQVVELKGIGQTYAFNGDTIYVKSQGGQLYLHCNSKYAKEFEHWKQYREANQGKSATRLFFAYFKQNPSSWAALDYFGRAIRNQQIFVDSARLIFSQMNIELQRSRVGKSIANDIRRQNNLSPGTQAPDFETTAWYYDAMGKRIKTEPLRLSNFRGKVVLMDFWASWCGPCRDGMAFVKKLYNELQESGLEVLAVNSDLVNFDISAWEKAIHHDGLHHFTHIQAAKNRYSPQKGEIAYDYYIGAIPLYVLIDKKGIIRGSWLAHNSSQEEEMENLIRLLVAE